MDEEKNTNVYVSGLPLDITDEEYKELMNKCGMIMYDPVLRGLKLKLYRDENGDPKGDGRCCYIKVRVLVMLRIYLLQLNLLQLNFLEVHGEMLYTYHLLTSGSGATISRSMF